MTPQHEDAGWRDGMRTGISLALAAGALAVTFGAFATLQGWPPLATIAMSALVFSGSAQFAFITATTGGAGLATGIGAAALMNLRFVPMAASAARSLRGGVVRRAFEGQAVVDGSWVAAQRSDGTTNREVMLGATLIQWPAWVLGTALGAILVPSPEFLHRLGLDVVFPCFFVLLLLDTLRHQPHVRPVAVAAAVIAGTAVVVLPAGVALLLSAAAAALALFRDQGTETSSQ
jgi:predicted branched-subunit amino acid permease